ncbi:MAG TPA: divergent polysaccharide deacetylase family protein [Methylocystis sp.]|nr:divergent polysaccharide deacetylase family protein [Methylocystis sp.]
MDDELHRPLGQNRRDAKRSPLSRRVWTTAGLGSGVVSLGAIALFFATRDPLELTLGGRPYAVARIEPYAPQPEPPQTATKPPVAEAESPTQSGRDQILSVGEVEQQSGVTVTRNGSSRSGAGPIIIEIESSGVRLPASPDKRVAEKSRYGVLPRIGADGAKPMDVYSRPYVAPARLKATAPKIALVVGGLGLNPQSTEAAINQLPEPVTLAFAPYGATVAEAAAQARARGHETLLQAPMEPFDYPQNSPGPHTLLTSGGEIEDLRWLMARFTGYAGVVSFLGGRFTADEKALSSALGELAQRGLYILDDGDSPQSLITDVAARLSLPAARVDIVLDGRTGTPQALDAALAQLEAQALKNGSAIGFANAQLTTIARLARFAREAERHGVAIAPVSAILGPAGHTAAIGGK